MNVFRLMRFFLPLQNPLGFGLTDYLELYVAALVVAAFLLRRRAEPILRKLADRPRLAAALLFALPIALRLALLPHHPAPIPQVADDFAYLLLGDTFAHLRLANPMHPMRRFFEAVFVLQDPSYSSIYPPGQGIVLALGQTLLGNPWAGVAASVGAMCAAVYWMLRAWVRPVPALYGGFLAVMEFGPMNQWMNNYWGGAVSAIAGCLIFGSIPRLVERRRAPDAVLLGIGIGLQTITRPFESVLLDLALIPVLVYALHRRFPPRLAAVAGIALLPFAVLTLLENKAVTGSFTTLPYMLSRYQYGVPAGFTFQPMPEPHRPLTQDQRLDYEAQKTVHAETPPYASRLLDRVRFLRFFLYAPLYPALAFFLPAVRRSRRLQWAFAAVALLFLGANFYPYFYPHYIAAATCVFVLIAVVGLERLAAVRIRGFAVGGDAARLLGLLCVAQFAFWYGLNFFGSDALFIAAGPYESWDYVNFGDAEDRLAIARKLAADPGPQLVFVRYGGQHFLREWIGNRADIDTARVVWALDLGDSENALLRAYYPKRAAWLLEPDARPPRLSPYAAATPSSDRGR